MGRWDRGSKLGGHHEKAFSRRCANSHTGPWKPAGLAFSGAFHDREGFVPISGIKSFAIMRNLAVTLISAIFKEPGSRRR
jgi:hypothetical protein